VSPPLTAERRRLLSQRLQARVRRSGSQVIAEALRRQRTRGEGRPSQQRRSDALAGAAPVCLDVVTNEYAALAPSI